MNTESKINLDDLKRDIEEQETLRMKFIKEANNCYYLVIVCVCLFLYFLVIGSYIVAASAFILGFMCLRRYNQCIGIAEVHTGIMKFLKMLLIQEQTGEDVFKNIVE